MALRQSTLGTSGQSPVGSNMPCYRFGQTFFRAFRDVMDRFAPAAASKGLARHVEKALAT